MNEYLSIPSAITFAAGASYGMTTVIVGQPLDTIKTRMQSFTSSTTANTMKERSSASMFQTGRNLFQREGIRGLYRGGLPLFIGGSLMRSAQFGFSGQARTIMKDRWGWKEYKLGGIIEYQVLLAGLAGGVGRALVEIPTDVLKIRRQVEQPLSKLFSKSLFDGTGVTMIRNIFLFTGFVFYIDLSKQLCQNTTNVVPSFLLNDAGDGLTPFAKGAICANMAWLTIWPIDVIKTQRQSGLYLMAGGHNLWKENIQNGRMFRGIVPGLLRSTISNGSSMVVYEKVHTYLSQLMGTTNNTNTKIN